MQRNLTRIGGSLGIIIPKAVLELLKLAEEDAVEISTDGHRLIIERAKSDRRKDIRKAGERVMKAHDSAFRKLAK